MGILKTETEMPCVLLIKYFLDIKFVQKNYLKLGNKAKG